MMKTCKKCGEEKELMQFQFNKRKDGNSATWKWQIDHIVPQSTFQYASIDCQEFRNCWTLSNLRPLSAKQNLLDGVGKIRHKEAV